MENHVLNKRQKIITLSTIYYNSSDLNPKTINYIVSYTMQKYKIVKSIGEGSFGIVFKAVDPNNQIVAIKKMLKQKYKTIEECNVLKEIKCLKKLDHPNIIKLKQVILANSELFMVFDYLQTNLFQVYTRAKESNRSLTENQIKSIFFKTASGLSFLHKNGFFHRDLKPQNILYHNNQLKICDFGLARQIRSKPPFTQYVSTRWYRAPQLLLHGTYNSPVDIFALACIIIELYTMNPLFPGQTEIDSMNRIVQVLGTPTRNEWPEGHKMASIINYTFPQHKKKELTDIIPNASVQAIDLLQSMLSYSSRKRPSASEILRHQYFQHFNGYEEKIVIDPKNETKFSFYQKNIIEIPSNLPKQNNKEMEMRKSLIKFGNSFTSSFHLSKQQKVQKVQKEKPQKRKSQLEFIMQSPKQQKIIPHKKPVKIENHDQISKKFDQMEEILMQLQKKQKQQKKHQPNYAYQTPSKHQIQSNEQQIKMPVFTFGGIGVNSLSTLNGLKNLKSPFIKSKLSESK